MFVFFLLAARVLKYRMIDSYMFSFSSLAFFNPTFSALTFLIPHIPVLHFHPCIFVLFCAANSSLAFSASPAELLDWSMQRRVRLIAS